MDYDQLVSFVQAHFTDGLTLVIGSGLSAAEGIPGMAELAEYLSDQAATLTGTDAAHWGSIKFDLDAGHGLESALLSHPPSDTLETWIAQQTCALLIPRERAVLRQVLRMERSLRLTRFFDRILKPKNGLPIVTSNYDRLVEFACEMAGFHVDSTAVGNYAGRFDPHRSLMGSCRGISKRGTVYVLNYFPRAIVLKPHGSFDWYQFGGSARRCSIDLDAPRLMITPGINKYRAGYEAPFDKHRDMANDYISRATHLLVIGYGFNDDHLETHLVRQIHAGTPTLILNRTASPKVRSIATDSPRCVCLSKPNGVTGVDLITNGIESQHEGHDLWDLGTLTEELLT